MARLRVRLNGKVVQDVQLSPDRSYVAGRREDCDIVLQNEKGISREHFKLSYVSDRWTLEVLSRFGDVTADGEKIQQIILEGPKVFFLPPYEFEYSEVSTQLVAMASGDKSLVSTGDDFADEHEKTFIGAANTVPYVKVVDDSGEVKELFKLEGGDTWIAGRDASCDIVIRDQRVSRRQFEIRRHGNQFFILDLGSVNGTLLNGSPVSAADPVLIKSSDGISVLDNHLYFELHDPNFNARMELVKATAPSPLVAISNDIVPQMPAQYQPQMQMPMNYGGYPSQGHGGYPMPEQKKKFDFEKHRIKLIAGALLFLAFAYYVSNQQDGGPKPAAQQPGAPMRPQEAFNKLPPEKQILVKQTYVLAKNLYMQGKYELAKSEISKIYELVPEYEDSKEIERLSNEALAIQVEKTKQEKLEKDRQENEERVQKQVAECKKKLNPDYTMDKLEDCLGPVLALNPEHPAILDLRHQVDQLVAEKQAKALQKQEYNAQVQKLRSMSSRAEATLKENQYLKAIKEFQAVASSTLPDPSDLKSQARKQIAAIQQTLKTKTDQYSKDADQAYKEQKLKDAIILLRKSLEVDPNNQDAKDKIDHYVLELKKQMMTLYQEGILEESYGNVEGSETKPGAKSKWNKILETDIPDGEYYGKAKIKLKKYGVL